MKKTFLLLLILATFSVSASAQATRYTATIAYDNTFGINNNDPCPVANYDESYSVAAVRMNATTTAFCLINHYDFVNTPAPAIPVPVPSITASVAYYTFNTPIVSFTVNDLVVVGQYAFFCGTLDDGTQQAFYGYFDINDFFPIGVASNVNVYVYCLTLGTKPPPATLNKLVAYKYNSMYKVVAIGDEKIIPHNCPSKIVEIFDATNTPVCKVADMPDFSVTNYNRKIYLDDIVLTYNYVVILGHDENALSICSSTPSTGYPWLSVGKRSDVIDEIFLWSRNYYLDHPLEALNAVAGVALHGDQIAISYVHYDEPTSTTYTRFRVIDIPSINNPYSQQFVKRNKENPVEMVFLDGIGSVELLQPIFHQSDFIQLFPYSNSNYTTTMFSPNSNEFKSLARLGSGTYWSFISTRNTEIYLQDRTVNLPHSTLSCPDEQSIDVMSINALQIIQSPCNIDCGTNGLFLFQSPYIQFGIPLPQLILNIQCHSYE